MGQISVPLAAMGIIAAMLTCSPSSAYATVLAASDFDSDSEGWTCTSDCNSVSPMFNESGGNPGGFLAATDFGIGDTFFFDAPDEFLGNKSSAFGGSLSFDLQQSPATGFVPFHDVLLSDGVTNLLLDTISEFPALTPNWTSYSVPFVGSAGWRVNSSAGPVATDAQMLAVLSNLTALQIRGEYSNVIDTGGLDNVELRALDIDAADFQGNSYQAFLSRSIDWDTANAIARALRLNGVPGHLATITSVDEDRFLETLRQAAGLLPAEELWTGGFQERSCDPLPRCGWQWLNGEGPFPGINDGSTYSNWAQGEPNGDGTAMAIGRFADIGWNDEGNRGFIHGYIVEWEGVAVPEPTTIALVILATACVGLSRGSQHGYSPDS